MLKMLFPFLFIYFAQTKHTHTQNVNGDLIIQQNIEILIHRIYNW